MNATSFCLGQLKVKEKTDVGYLLENGTLIEDTFAEMFSLWAGRILITAENEKWALTAANVTIGFGTSVIFSPAEAGIEQIIPKKRTPDNRVGILVQLYARSRSELKAQLVSRISQCAMTCPTTAVFNGIQDSKRKVKVGRSIRLFGDGFQRKGMVSNRKVWKIPVMDGDFIVEDGFGIVSGVAGGNFIILSRDNSSGLKAAEKAVKAIRENVSDVIMPFPGGICRSGSKIGSLKYKLPASTNHVFCPGLKETLLDSKLSEDVNCVYEIVINGLTFEAVKNGISKGVNAASQVSGVVQISAGNYGGKLGQYKIHFRDLLTTSNQI